MKTQFNKNNTLAAKGFAIILLLVHHLFDEGTTLSMGVDYSPWNLDSFVLVTSFGKICVGIFVLLTTYGISKGIFENPEYNAKQVCQSAVNRFFRLMFNFSAVYFSAMILWRNKISFRQFYGEAENGLVNVLIDATGLAPFFETPMFNMTWWYMEIAYVLIFLTPILAWIVKKIGCYSIIFLYFLPAIINISPNIKVYLPCAIVGVCAAHGLWLEKIMANKLNIFVKWIIAVIGFVICIFLRQSFVEHGDIVYFVEPWIALFIIWVSGVLINSIPIIGKVFVFLGKHSMNIFLIHTFFFLILWRNEIYYFKYVIPIFMALLISSLGYSIILELIKSIVLKCGKKIAGTIRNFYSKKSVK